MNQLDRDLRRVERYILKKLGKIGKKEAKPVIRSLKSQITKAVSRKTGKTGGPWGRWTGKSRKTIKAKNRFAEFGTKHPDGGRYFLKIKPWNPKLNYLGKLSEHGRHRRLDYNTPAVSVMLAGISRKIQPILEKKLRDIGQAAVDRQIDKIPP